MSKKTPPKELLSAMSERSLDLLRDIDCLHVCGNADDASGAIGSGAVLLAVAADRDTETTDGFRYLIGLPRGVAISPYLGNFFHR